MRGGVHILVQFGAPRTDSGWTNRRAKRQLAKSQRCNRPTQIRRFASTPRIHRPKRRISLEIPAQEGVSWVIWELQTTRTKSPSVDTTEGVTPHLASLGQVPIFLLG